MTPIERRILTAVTERKPDSRHKSALQRLMTQHVNQDLLIDLAVREGLAGLLYINLRQAELLEVLSLRQEEKLQALYHRIARSNLKRLHCLKKTLHQAAQKNIQVVILKGIALLEPVYGNVGLRPMGDVDIWVLKEHWPVFIPMLMENDYRRDPDYPNIFRKEGISLDLHSHFLGADRIKTRTFLLAKHQRHIFQNIRTTSIEGQTAYCLAPCDQVLYLGLHAMKHNLDKLIWLVDIKFLVADYQASDWQAVISRAAEMDQEKSILYVAYLLQHLLEFRFAPEVRRTLQRVDLNWIEKKVLDRKIKKGALPLWAPLVLFSIGKGVRRRFAFILETLFPRPEILRQVFAGSPARKDWQLYLMRVLQLFAKLIMPSK